MRRIPLFLMACILALVAVLGAVGVAGASDFQGTNSTLFSTAVEGDMAFDGGPVGAVLCRSAYYAPSTVSPAADSVVQVVPIPKGAMILNIVVHVPAGVSCTVDIGDGDDVDRFFDGLAAGANATLADDAASTASWNYIYTAADTIDMKVLGAAYGATNATKMDVYYKMVDGFIADEAAAFD